MFEKLRLIRDRSLTMANFPERVGDVYKRKGRTLLDVPLAYLALSGNEISAEDTIRFSCRVSRVLHEEVGVKRGEVVGVCTNNNVDLFLILMAVFKVGAIAVPLNYMLRQREIK